MLRYPGKDTQENLPSPLFKFDDLKSKDVIGRGAFGLVFKATYNGETVVVKKILGESLGEEDCFLKEAKLINSVKHENIVLFKGFCSSPYAIMMEYLCFEFSPFELSKQVSNLIDFSELHGQNRRVQLF